MPRPLALTSDEKEERSTDLAGNVEQLERLEEALIEKAIEGGSDILRRPDASPLAVLGVIFTRQKRSAAA